MFARGQEVLFFSFSINNKKQKMGSVATFVLKNMKTRIKDLCVNMEFKHVVVHGYPIEVLRMSCLMQL